MGGHRVVTIATAMGAGAEEIGRLVAEQLGFRYVNEHIIEWAAERAGVSRETIAQVERSQPLVARILQALGTFGAYQAPGLPAEAMDISDPSPEYCALIQDVIRQVAAAGEVVIVAHGAGVLLAGVPGVLRVFVTASPAVRVQRVAAERGCALAEAERMVRHSDGERAAYFRRFYNLPQELPVHYDLVVNTDALAIAGAARIVVAAAAVGAADEV